MHIAATDKTRRQQGFSLIELMVVLVLVAILAGLGMPSLRASIDRNAVSAEALRIVKLLNFARSEAVTKDQNIVIDPNSNGTNWGGGWNIYSDAVANLAQAFNAAEGDLLLQEVGSDASSVVITSNVNGSNRVMFQRNGRMVNAPAVQIAVCDIAMSDRVDGTLITINSVGRVRTSVIAATTKPGACAP